MTNSIKIITVIFAIFLIEKSAIAQNTQSFSIDQAVEYAVEHRPEVLKADLETNLSKAKVKEVFGIGLPQISGEVDVKDNFIIPTSVLPAEVFGGPPETYIPVQFGTQWNASAGVTFSQIIFSGSYLVGLKAAKVYTELADKSAIKTKQDIENAVRKAYYTVLINQEKIEYLKNQEKQVQKLYDDMQEIYKNGFAEKIDVDRTKVSLNTIKIGLNNQKMLLELSEKLLKFQMNYPIYDEMKLTDSIKSEMKVPSVEKIKADSSIISSRIEFSLLDTRKSLLLLDLKNQRIQKVPSLALYGTYSYSAYRTKFDLLDFDQDWYETGILGLKLSVPIFNGFQKNAKIQQAKIELQKLEKDYEALEKGISIEIESAQTQVIANYNMLEIKEENSELEKEIYRITKIKFKEGVGSSLEVIDAETRYENSVNDYLQAKLNYLVSKVELLKATGKLKYSK